MRWISQPRCTEVFAQLLHFHISEDLIERWHCRWRGVSRLCKVLFPGRFLLMPDASPLWHGVSALGVCARVAVDEGRGKTGYASKDDFPIVIVSVKPADTTI
jgi:hypothetical protein